MKAAAVFFALSLLARSGEVKGQWNKIVPEGSPARCGEAVDVVFVLDTSKSFKGNLRDAKNVVQRVVDGHETAVRDGRIRVAIAKIGSQMVLKRTLNASPVSTAQIPDAIAKVKCCAENSILGAALADLPQAFSTQEGGRPNSKHYAVFLSDGLATNVAKFPIDKAHHLKRQGIEVIFIVYYSSTGKKLIQQHSDVNKMVTNPSHKLNATSRTVEADLARLMGLPECPPTTPPPATPPPTTPPPTTPPPTTKPPATTTTPKPTTTPPPPTTTPLPTTTTPEPTTTPPPPTTTPLPTTTTPEPTTTPPPPTTTPLPCPVTKAPLSTGCEDKYPGCGELGPRVCTSLDSWARIYCAASCGFCSASTCLDVVGNCSIFGDTICSAAPLSAWVDVHCREFCNRC